MKKIQILFNNFTIQAEISNSVTAQEIYSALPFESTVNTWGDEIYFEIPIPGFWMLRRQFDIF